MDRQQSLEQHLRGDRPRAAATPAAASGTTNGEMTFNPAARPGDADWRVMYLGVGDAGSGEQRGSRRLNPQRLDTLVGKILRIVPDLREHTNTSRVSENGALPDPERQSILDGRRRTQGRSGPTACATRTG